MSRTIQTHARTRTTPNTIIPPTQSAREDMLSSLMDLASQARLPSHTPSTPTPSVHPPLPFGDGPDLSDHGEGGDDDPDNNSDNNNEDNDNHPLGNAPDPDNLPPNPIMVLVEAIHSLVQLSR
ncbi:hypothetical protein PAXRUDRAFT_19245 [Paxillus rubicundulus Ve08.2h10]|uniref:Uncharacterized protein n=1 Tax=Paxillus rubicundulus Ve08.2h10 TaxID=930991 RepID=A0A0D0CVJ6_9AGAM|nr:hypothetical protein PAXRUDRAFT_19245 [Paxillus rubicundulus Ve08.2h10]